ncbi:phi LC3 family holin [Anoxybacillus voinovskiensis]|uniref:Phi LC3 family holin n=1 Tax=Anoxybacteroides voinovskiense TaxID=230470 RepID=A0A840DUN6_9BACL|nr:phage holin [Anoxybacillus voinovskiensis]MBB4074047.1 phi LC3 family holin [Anoxybacillus voinovskiensis]GGJ68257.1 hypothetical protein GCM10008982_16980 [Anoxybacillus voinovskiensis]
MNLKKRLRNYGLWISLASFILLVLQTFGVQIDAGKYNTIVNAVLTFFVTLGIINDPTTENKGYGDDKQ